MLSRDIRNVHWHALVRAIHMCMSHFIYTSTHTNNSTWNWGTECIYTDYIDINRLGSWASGRADLCLSMFMICNMHPYRSWARGSRPSQLTGLTLRKENWLKCQSSLLDMHCSNTVDALEFSHCPALLWMCVNDICFFWNTLSWAVLLLKSFVLCNWSLMNTVYLCNKGI